MNRQAVDSQGVPYSMFNGGLILCLALQEKLYGFLSWRVILPSENVLKVYNK